MHGDGHQFCIPKDVVLGTFGTKVGFERYFIKAPPPCPREPERAEWTHRLSLSDEHGDRGDRQVLLLLT